MSDIYIDSDANVEITNSCIRIVKSLQSTAGNDFFNGPLDRQAYSRYYLRVPKPIDFLTIKSKLGAEEVYGFGKVSNRGVQSKPYRDHNDFARDIRRLCGNAIRYYSGDSNIAVKKRKIACNILSKFESLWDELETDMAELHSHSKVSLRFNKVIAKGAFSC
jgi:hypothetical protein